MSHLSRTLALVLVALGLLAILTLVLGQPTASAQGGAGVIAYVRADTRDHIRLINPDGSNDRLLWAHGNPDPVNFDQVWSLDWKPDGTELAFASTHEAWCSIQSSDVFAVGTTGAGYRRVTQAPACGTLASYPQGVVRVPVHAPNGFNGYVYFQGAPSAQPVNLAPGGSTVVTFPHVADLGSGVLQLAALIVGGDRDPSPPTAVDVQAGATVTTPEMNLYSPVSAWDARSPTWRSDGSKIGYVWDSNTLLALAPHPAALALGDDLLAASWADPPYFTHLAWGPAARANQLLYVAQTWDFSDGTTENIYLVNQGSSTAGQRLFQFYSWQNVLGLAWLPDGSGFVYSVLKLDEVYQPSGSQIFLYTFATQTNTLILDLTGEYVGQLDLSPDGQRIVFERGDEVTNSYALHSSVVDPDLWIVNRTGSGTHLLVTQAAAPAWGLNVPPPPPQPTTTPGGPPVPSATPGGLPPTATPPPTTPYRSFLPLTRR